MLRQEPRRATKMPAARMAKSISGITRISWIAQQRCGRRSPGVTAAIQQSQVTTFYVSRSPTIRQDLMPSIGRRYARADEVGVSLGITVDYDTLKDETVTIRDRDTWKQVRSRIEDLPELLHKYFRWKINFEELGTSI